ncbi:hypothetical protein L0P88_03940 [Muricauda sp. SCSIO 64092]|uniref:hypothetical protein n=1 Tax=Allomuricauda sp. SCSIO 64092 TaxID=2908842 RepID=UPI001FF665E6|nr:hypothetical protein [Muricauda sp. SCSIO 64092]UOY07705.1 hypothetical protein L0P88_03940 [Muricauda sp. SCSIO 64092]
MAATDVLKERTAKKFIEQKYIDRVLRYQGEEMLRQQDRVISRYGVRKTIPEISRRRISVSNSKLTGVHPIRQRFIDMKTIRGQRQKAVHIHNKIIYSGFNAIVGRLAFGLTQDVKNLIANDYKIQM